MGVTSIDREDRNAGMPEQSRNLVEQIKSSAMYQVRETFHCKPGKAKELVRMFKRAIPHFEKTEGGRNYKVMTDIVGQYWTVVMELEVDDIGSFIGSLRQSTGSAELKEILKGYTELIESGSREIFLLE